MKDLNSKDNSKVEAELDRAEKNGDIKWVKPLLHAFRDRPEDALRERMRTMLSTIKLSGAEGIYIEELEIEIARQYLQIFGLYMERWV